MDGMLEGQIILYDTTLRDGAQSEAISLSVDDKLKITHLLDRLGVHYIEGGWPGSNPKDAEYFQRVHAEKLEQILVAAFGSTCRVGTRPADDANIRALLVAETPVVTVVGKSWTLHVRDVLRASLDENLHIIRESLAYLKAQRREVIYDAEHDMDWDLSGDSHIEDDAEFDKRTAYAMLNAVARGITMIQPNNQKEGS